MPTKKVALITGVTGQDGSYLAEFLIKNSYKVHGIIRNTNKNNASNINHLINRTDKPDGHLFLHECNLDDFSRFAKIVKNIRPDEIYHLAGQSNVATSLQDPLLTCEISGNNVLKILEQVRQFDISPKFFHASSSEVFGRPFVMPQDESTQHFPINPYGCAKSFATNIVRIYRERYGLFAVNGILYNHESPRRGKDFVTRKITRAAAAIKLGLQKELLVGDISSKRDWGYAPDYVQGMWLSLQALEPDDYVFATGELHSVQDVIDIAFSTLGLSSENYVKVDPNLVRISDPSRLVGNSIKALHILGWKPKVPFKQIIEEMTLSDLDILTNTRGRV